MKPIAMKFVIWDVPELAALQDSPMYQIRQLLNEGKKMNRVQKNWLTSQVNHNACFKRGIPLMGYQSGFSDVFKHYFVEQYGHIQEYYVVDKTALRSILCGRVDEIVET